MARNGIATRDSKYSQKKRRNVDETEVHYREETRQPWHNPNPTRVVDKKDAPYQNPIVLDTMYENEVGCIVEVYGVVDNRRVDTKGNSLPNPYYVAHSWNDEDHKSWHFEGMFADAQAAQRCLFDL